ncbi:heat-shock protein Hsp20 [Candidatus Methylomirabilis limnetica]|uniref:Heat-shock protein Hsp20 n=1 Tax=Candidatus Methylomirabilis limnetica TaxID=2033718 RepID=A0A2T4TYQ3_9BACT|nr:archaeal heat shock protein Hsp20 [Candidatus Methylomirabilis limnetica]PTL36255.1 heat-shock protein Hsp20 [Candidatus Methylomirabilis limnetica]
MTERKGGAGFGLGDLFKGIGDLIELLKEMEAEGKTETTRTGELRGKGRLKDLRGVYGFNVKVGLGGEPTVETFGNIKKGEAGAVVEEVREPLVDVFDENEAIRVIAEMPGVDTGDVRVELKDDILTISAEGKDRKYSKEILLPAKGKQESLKTSYRNGILEVTVAKAGKSA